ncbi:hypothetical protein Q9233_011056 [Columba guinea]|nr:hypothetical protein Q9233_011056 [Columba guinea]
MVDPITQDLSFLLDSVKRQLQRQIVKPQIRQSYGLPTKVLQYEKRPLKTGKKATEDVKNQLLAFRLAQPPDNMGSQMTNPAAELPSDLHSHSHRGAEKDNGSAQDTAGSSSLCSKPSKAPHRSLSGREGSHTWARSDVAALQAGREGTVEDSLPPADGAKRQQGQKRAAAAQQPQRVHTYEDLKIASQNYTNMDLSFLLDSVKRQLQHQIVKTQIRQSYGLPTKVLQYEKRPLKTGKKATEDVKNQLLAFRLAQPPDNMGSQMTNPAAELPSDLHSHGHRGAEKDNGSAQDTAGSSSLCSKLSKAPHRSLSGREGSHTWAPSDAPALQAGREGTVEDSLPPKDRAKRQQGQKRAAAAQQPQRVHACMSVQLWVMSWFLSQEAFVVFLALLWLLLVLLLFHLLLILANPQEGRPKQHQHRDNRGGVRELRLSFLSDNSQTSLMKSNVGSSSRESLSTLVDKADMAPASSVQPGLEWELGLPADVDETLQDVPASALPSPQQPEQHDVMVDIIVQHMPFLDETVERELENDFTNTQVQPLCGLPTKVLENDKSPEDTELQQKAAQAPIPPNVDETLQDVPTLAVPSPRQPEEHDVMVDPITQDLSFLADAVKRQLERHIVQKQIEKRYGLPTEVLQYEKETSEDSELGQKAAQPPVQRRTGLPYQPPFWQLDKRKLNRNPTGQLPLLQVESPEPVETRLLVMQAPSPPPTPQRSEQHDATVFPVVQDLDFLKEAVKRRLERHIVKLQIQKRCGWPTKVLQMEKSSEDIAQWQKDAQPPHLQRQTVLPCWQAHVHSGPEMILGVTQEKPQEHGKTPPCTREHNGTSSSMASRETDGKEKDPETQGDVHSHPPSNQAQQALPQSEGDTQEQSGQVSESSSISDGDMGTPELLLMKSFPKGQADPSLEEHSSSNEDVGTPGLRSDLETSPIRSSPQTQCSSSEERLSALPPTPESAGTGLQFPHLELLLTTIIDYCRARKATEDVKNQLLAFRLAQPPGNVGSQMTAPAAELPSMSVQLWVMSWFLSQEAFVVFLALLWLLLVLLLFHLLLILANPQEGRPKQHQHRDNRGGVRELRLSFLSDNSQTSLMKSNVGSSSRESLSTLVDKADMAPASSVQPGLEWELGLPADVDETLQDVPASALPSPQQPEQHDVMVDIIVQHMPFLDETVERELENDFTNTQVQPLCGLPTKVLENDKSPEDTELQQKAAQAPIPPNVDETLQDVPTLAVPSPRQPEEHDVMVDPITQDLSFLADAVKRQLERHIVQKQIEKRYGLPTEVLQYEKETSEDSELGQKAAQPPVQRRTGLPYQPPFWQLDKRKLNRNPTGQLPLLQVESPEPVETRLLVMQAPSPPPTPQRSEQHDATVFPVVQDLDFLKEAVKRRLERHIVKLQIQKRCGWPTKVLQMEKSSEDTAQWQKDAPPPHLQRQTVLPCWQAHVHSGPEMILGVTQEKPQEHGKTPPCTREHSGTSSSMASRETDGKEKDPETQGDVHSHPPSNQAQQALPQSEGDTQEQSGQVSESSSISDGDMGTPELLLMKSFPKGQADPSLEEHSSSNEDVGTPGLRSDLETSPIRSSPQTQCSSSEERLSALPPTPESAGTGLQFPHLELLLTTIIDYCRARKATEDVKNQLLAFRLAQPPGNVGSQMTAPAAELPSDLHSHGHRGAEEDKGSTQDTAGSSSLCSEPSKAAHSSLSGREGSHTWAPSDAPALQAGREGAVEDSLPPKDRAKRQQGQKRAAAAQQPQRVHAYSVKRQLQHQIVKTQIRQSYGLPTKVLQYEKRPLKTGKKATEDVKNQLLAFRLAQPPDNMGSQMTNPAAELPSMSVQLWVMSWFLSQEAFVVFLALLWLLLVLLLFHLLLILAKPQEGRPKQHQHRDNRGGVRELRLSFLSDNSQTSLMKSNVGSSSRESLSTLVDKADMAPASSVQPGLEWELGLPADVDETLQDVPASALPSPQQPEQHDVMVDIIVQHMPFLDETVERELENDFTNTQVQPLCGLPTKVLENDKSPEDTELQQKAAQAPIPPNVDETLQDVPTLAVPSPRQPEEHDVMVDPITQDLSFLADAVKRQLERHIVQKQIEKRYGLPTEVLQYEKETSEDSELGQKAAQPPVQRRTGLPYQPPFWQLDKRKLNRNPTGQLPLLQVESPEPVETRLLVMQAPSPPPTPQRSEQHDATVFPVVQDLDFLKEAVKRRLERHIVKLQIQKRCGWPTKVLQMEKSSEDTAQWQKDAQPPHLQRQTVLPCWQAHVHSGPEMILGVTQEKPQEHGKTPPCTREHNGTSSSMASRETDGKEKDPGTQGDVHSHPPSNQAQQALPQSEGDTQEQSGQVSESSSISDGDVGTPELLLMKSFPMGQADPSLEEHSSSNEDVGTHGLRSDLETSPIRSSPQTQCSSSEERLSALPPTPESAGTSLQIPHLELLLTTIIDYCRARKATEDVQNQLLAFRLAQPPGNVGSQMTAPAAELPSDLHSRGHRGAEEDKGSTQDTAGSSSLCSEPSKAPHRSLSGREGSHTWAPSDAPALQAGREGTVEDSLPPKDRAKRQQGQKRAAAAQQPQRVHTYSVKRQLQHQIVKMQIRQSYGLPTKVLQYENRPLKTLWVMSWFLSQEAFVAFLALLWLLLVLLLFRLLLILAKPQHLSSRRLHGPREHYMAPASSVQPGLEWELCLPADVDETLQDVPASALPSPQQPEQHDVMVDIIVQHMPFLDETVERELENDFTNTQVQPLCGLPTKVLENDKSPEDTELQQKAAQAPIPPSVDETVQDVPALASPSPQQPEQHDVMVDIIVHLVPFLDDTVKRGLENDFTNMQANVDETVQDVPASALPSPQQPEQHDVMVDIIVHLIPFLDDTVKRGLENDFTNMQDLSFLADAVKRQLECHIMKKQIQKRYGLPTEVLQYEKETSEDSELGQKAAQPPHLQRRTGLPYQPPFWQLDKRKPNRNPAGQLPLLQVESPEPVETRLLVMQAPSPPPTPQRSEQRDATVFPVVQDLDFLKEAVKRRLERHIVKLQIQKRCGWPTKVLQMEKSSEDIAQWQKPAEPPHLQRQTVLPCWQAHVHSGPEMILGVTQEKPQEHGKTPPCTKEHSGTSSSMASRETDGKEKDPETQGDVHSHPPSNQAQQALPQSEGDTQEQSGQVSESSSISDGDMGTPELLLMKSFPMGQADPSLEEHSSSSEDVGTPGLRSDLETSPIRSSPQTQCSSSEERLSALPPTPESAGTGLQIPHLELLLTTIIDYCRARKSTEDVQNQLLAFRLAQPPGNVGSQMTDPAAELPSDLHSRGHRGAEKDNGSAQDTAGSSSLCSEPSKAPHRSLAGREGSHTWAPSDAPALQAGREGTVEDSLPPKDRAKRQQGQKRAAAAQQPQRVHACSCRVHPDMDPIYEIANQFNRTVENLTRYLDNSRTSLMKSNVGSSSRESLSTLVDKADMAPASSVQPGLEWELCLPADVDETLQDVPASALPSPQQPEQHDVMVDIIVQHMPFLDETVERELENDFTNTQQPEQHDVMVDIIVHLVPFLDDTVKRGLENDFTNMQANVDETVQDVPASALPSPQQPEQHDVMVDIIVHLIPFLDDTVKRGLENDFTNMQDLSFLADAVKRQLECHIMKKQIQKRYGLPTEVLQYEKETSEDSELGQKAAQPPHLQRRTGLPYQPPFWQLDKRKPNRNPAGQLPLLQVESPEPVETRLLVMQAPSPPPTPQRSEQHDATVFPVVQDLDFLKEAVKRRLERHIVKLQIQKRCGWPTKVLQMEKSSEDIAQWQKPAEPPHLQRQTVLPCWQAHVHSGPEMILGVTQEKPQEHGKTPPCTKEHSGTSSSMASRETEGKENGPGTQGDVHSHSPSNQAQQALPQSEGDTQEQSGQVSESSSISDGDMGTPELLLMKSFPMGQADPSLEEHSSSNEDVGTPGLRSDLETSPIRSSPQTQCSSSEERFSALPPTPESAGTSLQIPHLELLLTTIIDYCRARKATEDVQNQLLAFRLAQPPGNVGSQMTAPAAELPSDLHSRGHRGAEKDKGGAQDTAGSSSLYSEPSKAPHRSLAGREGSHTWAPSDAPALQAGREGTVEDSLPPKDRAKRQQGQKRAAAAQQPQRVHACSNNYIMKLCQSFKEIQQQWEDNRIHDCLVMIRDPLLEALKSELQLSQAKA